MYIYRITRYRDKPRYYQGREQVVYGTGKRAAANAQWVKGRTTERVTVERAPVGDFEDVTAEFTGRDDE